MTLVIFISLSQVANALTFTVTNLNNSGPGSLSELIAMANVSSGPDDIDFAVSGTIAITTALPALTEGGTTIDGANNITLDGVGLGSGSGIEITSANNVLNGLTIVRFSEHGISISGSTSSGNTITGCHIGNNGSTALGNGVNGIYIFDAPNTNIGGETVPERNIISGNTSHGILVENTGATGNVISGNYIGLDATGTIALGNGDSGVIIQNDAKGNQVGGNTAGQRNIISSNNENGIWIVDNDIGGPPNSIQGNYIGTDVTGTLARPNALSGITIGASTGVDIGGALAGTGNVISGNGTAGISTSSASSGIRIQGNTIGRAPDAFTPLPNGNDGIWILDSSNVTIGGSVSTSNVIASNSDYGVHITGGTSSGNSIGANAILENSNGGIFLESGANAGITPPTIDTTVPITGSAPGDSTVQFFSDSGAQGTFFLGETTALPNGAFSANIDLTSYNGTNLTATATDLSGNTSEFSLPKGIDFDPPTVFSISRVTANPTGLSSLIFYIQFTEDVTGVDTSDFTIASSGITGALITDVSGSGRDYFVTVDSGTGNGTLGLDLVDDDSVLDMSGNPLGGVDAGNGDFIGDFYDIDKVRPTVTLTTIAPDPTSLASIPVLVTFSELATGLISEDLVVVNATVVNFTGSGKYFAFDLEPISPGPVAVHLDEGAAQDLAGNISFASNTVNTNYNAIAVGALRGTAINANTDARLGCVAVRVVSQALNVNRISVADKNGAFYLRDLPVGAYTVDVYSPGFAIETTSVDIDPAKTTYIIARMEPETGTALISGQVTDNTTGNPISGARIDALIGGNLVATVYACANGRYAIYDLGLKGGDVDVTLEYSSPNYTDETRDVAVDSDGVEVDVPMGKSAVGLGALAVEVLNSDNQDPLPTARVTLNGVVNLTQAVPSGDLYTFPDLPAGTYEMTTSAVGYATEYAVVNILGLGIETLTVQLDPGTASIIPGDVNDSGGVDAVDVQNVINAALGLPVAYNCDLDLNLEIDAIDVQLTINYALGIGK